MQGGSYDCAVAFATAAAYGVNPARCCFDQKKIRKHLYHCLSNGKLTTFPQRKGTSSKRAIVYDEIKVHCHCRMPELKNVAMIECNSCCNWFHVFCDNVSKKCLDDSSTEWFCNNCRKA